MANAKQRATMYNNRPHHENLLFVKNVPSDLANEGIPRLFKQYRPIYIKYIYPNSGVSTVVLTFRCPADVARAKEGSQDMRLGNAVLRTELYEDVRSIRYNQEQARGKANGKEEAGTEDAEEVPETAPAYTIRNKPHSRKGLVAAKPLEKITGNTWADIASKPRIEERSEFPHLPTASSPKTAQADVDQTGTTSAVPPNNPLFGEESPQFAPATDAPRAESAEQGSDVDDEDSDASPCRVSHDTSLVTDDAPSTAHTTPEKGAGKAKVGSGERRNMVRNDAAPAQQPINISFAYDSNARDTPGPSQILDTTARIRAQHQPHCTFCARRNAVRARVSEVKSTEVTEEC